VSEVVRRSTTAPKPSAQPLATTRMTIAPPTEVRYPRAANRLIGPTVSCVSMLGRLLHSGLEQGGIRLVGAATDVARLGGLIDTLKTLRQLMGWEGGRLRAAARLRGQ
jgi:hypothetical protein